ncbi:MAG: GNAT family N-acetyltransferase [Proteobacteria bacterium]|nr:GNAT family N-acetyltransferase [Pseudomonadota bacterium]
MRIAVDPGEDVAPALDAGLKAFNERIADTSDPQQVQVSVRDDGGKIVGGVVGRVWMGSFYIGTVWIDDSLRGKGHGKAMLEMAEAEGRRLGAKMVWLHTLSWQARPFYEALGYDCFGEVPVSGGHFRYFMRKTL